MKFDHLIDRIEYILDGRKIYPWANSMGLSNGVVEPLKKNNLPGGEILALICRVENASFNWLSTGRGAPFYVGKSVTQDEFAERIHLHLEDSGEWKVSLVKMDNMPELAIAIFQMPGEHDYKGKPVPYTIMEVECGRWSSEASALLQTVKGLACYSIASTQKAAAHEFMQVWDGLAGTFRISRWLKEMAPCFPQVVMEQPRERYSVREPSPIEIEPRRLRDVILAVKSITTKEHRELTEEQFSTVVATLYRHAPTSGEIHPTMVGVAVDSVVLQENKPQG